MTFTFIREMTDEDNSICYELQFVKTSSLKLAFQTFMENETSSMEKYALLEAILMKRIYDDLGTVVALYDYMDEAYEVIKDHLKNGLKVMAFDHENVKTSPIISIGKPFEDQDYYILEFKSRVYEYNVRYVAKFRSHQELLGYL